MDLRGKRALVMGLGVHGGGLGVARFLVGQGADVTVTDLRSPAQLQTSLEALAGLPIRFVLGRHDEADFRTTDLVVRNPGVPRESPYLQAARAAGAAIEMEMTLFFRLCPGPILGITGTKGKTTTTLLTGAMLRAQYPDTVVAGNLRVSALEALPRITAGTPVVLELSSWQLEGLGEAQLSPQYACVTNLSPDHLDRYGSMEAYAEAKKQIFLHHGKEGIVALNWDDALLHDDFAPEAPGEVVWFSHSAGPVAGDERCSFYLGNDLFWGWRNTIQHQRQDMLIASLDNPHLPGNHSRANVAAAAALARSFGIEIEHIRAAIRNFGGVEHRLEFVREIDGVQYINDTAATAPEAAIAALYSFEQPIVLLAGGADKNLPFDDLARAIATRAKAVVLLNGSATPKLEQALRSALQNVQTFKRSNVQTLAVEGPFSDFAEAIAAARELAEPGDVVLLAPGCASFGMFRNEFHRGDEFKRIVHQL